MKFFKQVIKYFYFKKKPMKIVIPSIASQQEFVLRCNNPFCLYNRKNVYYSMVKDRVSFTRKKIWLAYRLTEGRTLAPASYEFKGKEFFPGKKKIKTIIFKCLRCGNEINTYEGYRLWLLLNIKERKKFWEKSNELLNVPMDKRLKQLNKLFEQVDVFKDTQKGYPLTDRCSDPLWRLEVDRRDVGT